MNGLQIFLLGIGSVAVLALVAGLWWFTTKNTVVKMPGNSVRMLTTIVMVLAFVLVFIYFKDDVVALLADSPFWTSLAGIAIVGLLVYLIYNRRKGFETIRGASIFLLMVAGAGFITNIMDKAVEPTPLGDACTNQRWFFNNELDAEGSRVWLLPGAYKVRVPNGKEGNFRIEFLDSPLAYDPSFEPGDIEKSVIWYPYGSPGAGGNGLTVGSGRLVIKDVYQKRIGNRCLGYHVYVD